MNFNVAQFLIIGAVSIEIPSIKEPSTIKWLVDYYLMVIFAINKTHKIECRFSVTVFFLYIIILIAFAGHTYREHLSLFA